jgi:hypothetical protein
MRAKRFPFKNELLKYRCHKCGKTKECAGTPVRRLFLLGPGRGFEQQEEKFK